MDHVLFVLVAIVQPIVGYRSFVQLQRLAAVGQRIDLAHLYKRTIIGQWLVFTLLVLIWHSDARPWSHLGFSLRADSYALAGALLAIAVLLILIARLRRLAVNTANTRDALLKRLDRVAVILPRTRKQLQYFYAVSATAGVVEEAIWRGFMIWYLGQLLPLWAAVAGSAIGFGLAHAYQGIANVPKATLAGAVFALIYVLTGSLLLPVLLHALADALQGRAIYRLLR